MGHTIQQRWAKRRQDIILRLLDRSPHSSATAQSAEAILAALTALHRRQDVLLRSAPPSEECGFNVSSIRRDFERLQSEGFLRMFWVRHSWPGAHGIPKFYVAQITTEGRKRARTKMKPWRTS